MKLLLSDNNNNQNLENSEKLFSKKNILKENELKQIKGGTGDEEEDNESVLDWE